MVLPQRKRISLRMTRKPIDLNISYRLLNHGPLVLVSSIFKGRPDITPIAWNMPISDDPPMIALEIWEGHFIYKAILETEDFVVNIPSSDMAETVRKLGSVSGSKIDKFREYGLEPEPSKTVKSPRLKIAMAVMECKLHQDKHVLDEYNIVIGDVQYAEAEASAFSNRWLPEKGAFKTLHHLGDRIFCIPESKLI